MNLYRGEEKMENRELQQYLQAQIVRSQMKLEGIANDIHNKPLFKRRIFIDLQKYALSFLVTRTEPRMIIMPGLRGAGKTTLLAQLYLSLSAPNISKLYLSVEEAIKRFDVNLWEIMENYESIIGKHVEEFDSPFFLFLDEIHYDENWAIFLKTIYDKSKNIMIFCTGSAALLLREQINSDVARRVYFIDVNPVSFPEYMLFKYNKSVDNETGIKVKEAIFFSSNAKEVYTKLKVLEKEIHNYWLDIDSFEIQRYLKVGTFPFTLNLENEVLANNFIYQVINKVIYSDIQQYYHFEIATLNRIDKLLYLISDTLGVSLSKLSEILEIKQDTLRLILRALERSGLISRIPPFGVHFKQVKKPSKYLFATPALRFSYLSSKESVAIFENYQGSLFEDIVGMYLNHVLPPFGEGALTYDVAEGGADFIVSIANRKIIIEIGAGKKDYKQIIQTSKRVKSKYSIVISNNALEYSDELNAIKIPMKYFLLIHG